MDDFLKEQELLLRRYKATILRSANSRHDLCISLPDYGTGNFLEIYLDEEMSADDIKYNRFTKV